MDNLQALREATALDDSGNLKQSAAAKPANPATILHFTVKGTAKQQSRLAVEEELP